MSAFIHLIADYGTGDPSFSEVIQRLKHEDPTIDVNKTAVAPFSTVATGFWIEQLGVHNPGFDELTIYSNTAPRADETGPRDSNAGEQLCYLELDSGTPVMAINGGYNLSFVKDNIVDFRTIDAPEQGSQFRSRDYFPTRVAEIANGNFDSIGDELSVEEIPGEPESTICHVDGYGNIKTSIRDSEFDPEGEQLTVEIDTHLMDAVHRDAVFEAEEGSLVIAPGSSGGEDPYLEIVHRGGSAAELFDQPSPGDTIDVR